MTESAPASPAYRAWRPARTNDTARPVYEPPSLAERRRAVRAGFDRAFVDALAERLGITSDALLEQVGAGQAAPPTTGRGSRRASWQLKRMVIREGASNGGTWVVSPVPDAEVTGSGTVMTVRGAPLTRTARTLSRSIGWRGREGHVVPSSASARSASGGLSPSDAVAGRPTRVIGAAADQLYERHRLVEHAEAVLGDPASVPVWFGAELGALGDTRPLDWLDTAAGRERLAEVLDAIAYGFPG